MSASSHLVRGSPGYRRATLALFCAGFATFALLYCVQPLLPSLAEHFTVSAASSALALSLTTLSLALCLLLAGALAESWGRKPVMVAALGLAAPPFSLSATLIGLLFVVYLGGILSAGWAGRLVARHGARQVLQGGIGIMLLGVALCAAPWLWAVVLGLALFTLGFFAAHAVASGQVGQRARGARAQASSLYLCAYYLGSSLVGYAAGWVWQRGGWLALLAALAGLFLLALWRSRRL